MWPGVGFVETRIMCDSFGVMRIRAAWRQSVCWWVWWTSSARGMRTLERRKISKIKIGLDPGRTLHYLLILVTVVIVFWPQEMGYRDGSGPSRGVRSEYNIPGNNSWMLGRVNWAWCAAMWVSKEESSKMLKRGLFIKETAKVYDSPKPGF